MKRLVFSLIVVLAASRAFCQPNITNLSFPSTVDLFGLYEISFKMGNYANPYDPDTISVYALFYGPNDDNCKVNAFYYEGYSFHEENGYEVADYNFHNNCWKIRFTPVCTGNWQFRILAQDHTGTTVQMPSDTTTFYTFTCNSVQNGEGFISKANSRFLKRDVVIASNRQYHSFFPIGPNVAWYDFENYGIFTHPYGIYEYEKYLDSLDGRANYMRIFLNRYQCISLYGPEYALPNSSSPVTFFDNTVNQKDSAELDYIIEYAKQHGVTIMPCIFNQGDFRTYNPADASDSSKWANNPFHTILGLENPCDFFTDEDAISITKNLLRYIVSRWGYATNIVAWEFWNEVDQAIGICDYYKHIEQDVVEWHEELLNYLKTIDPYHHCATTSMAGPNRYSIMYSGLFDDLDFVQIHNYENIQNAENRFQVPLRLLYRVNNDHIHHPTKPSFIGECGFSQGNSTHIAKDPNGINLHNSNWASLFSSAISAGSFWWWPYIDSCGLFQHFAPLSCFCQDLPIPSASFTGHHTGEMFGNQMVFPNGLQTFYMENANQDTIYGWSQDTAFTYPSLRRLTDSVEWVGTDYGLRLHFKNNGVFDPLGYVYTLDPAKRPSPSSNSNRITLPITNQPVGTTYLVRWYDTETGAPLNLGAVFYAKVQQDSLGNKAISFQFPSLIRDLQHQMVKNKFGDAVFVLVPAPPPIDKKTPVD